MGSILQKIKIAQRILKEEGWKMLMRRIQFKIRRMTVGRSEIAAYHIWIQQNEKGIYKTEPLDYTPLISVVVPVYNVKTEILKECIESVRKQTYENWELCLADDASTWKNVRECLEKYEKDGKIKIKYRKENGHISLATNSAIEMAEGEFIAFMDCDDVLAPNALYEVAKKLNEDKTLDFIYSDEDKLNENGKTRHQPHFKPDWSPDTFMSLMYTCHLAVYRKSIGDEIGWLRQGYEGAQDYDFTLRFTEVTGRIGHIQKVLYHWREREESTAVNPEAKSYILDTAKRAKEDAMKRRGLQGECEWISGIYQYRVNYKPAGNPLISIIIPSKDNFKVCRHCIDSILEKTSYKNYEILVVDNGSSSEQKKLYGEYSEKAGIKYYFEPMEFNFSKMCNKGAAMAKGELFLFLNDDTEVITPVWLERMAGHAMLSHVGAVGAKLLYPQSTLIQHIGVISLKDGPVHSFCQYDDADIYYFDRNKIEYNYSAVTAACLMVEKTKFYKAGGFDETFAVAYNDVKFCFDLLEKGYYNVSRMDAVLYHYESLSRGDDRLDPAKEERRKREWKRLYDAHPEFMGKDRFYNPNLTMQLADCSVNIDRWAAGK